MAQARYMRLVGMSAYAGGDLELGALELTDGGVRVDAAATVTCAHAPVSGALSNLGDGDDTTKCRWGAAQVRSAGFAVVWDFGVSTAVSGLRVAAGASNATFLGQFDLQTSAEGVTWVLDRSVARVVWPGVGASRSVGFGDVWYPRMALLLHGDAFADSSAVPKTVTPSGTVAVDAGWKPLGVNTIKFGGGHVTMTPVTEFGWGTGDFTVEGYVKVDTAHTYGMVWCIGSYGFSRGFYGAIDGSKIYLGSLNPFASIVIDYTADLSVLRAGTYLSWMRDATGCHLYVAGIKVATVARSTINVAPERVRVGDMNQYSGSDVMGIFPFKGWVGEFRAIGRAVRDGNFTPPSVLYAGGGTTGVVEPGKSAPGPYDAGVVASASVPPHAALSTAALDVARDVEFGGRCAIVGFTKIKGSPNTPFRCRVRLLRDRDAYPVRETWSDAVTGAFAFTSLNEAYAYTAYAQDHTGNYRAVMADRIIAEAP